MKLFEKTITIHVANTVPEDEFDNALNVLDEIFGKLDDATFNAVNASAVARLNGFRIEIE